MKSIAAKKQARTGRRREAVRRLRPTVLALEARTLLATFTVTSLADDASTQGTLRWAIGQANATAGANTINFSNLFDAPQTIALTGGVLELTGTHGTTAIQGPGAKMLRVSGNQASQVFEVGHGARASISGLTITGARTQRAGGGLVNYGTLALTDCTVSGNSAPAAAGLSNNGGTATLTGCTLSGNTAAAEGGGAENFNGKLTLDDCTVSGNTAGTTGGGLENFNGPITVTDCTISGNTAAAGGGLTNFVGTAALTACTVSGNTATTGGGLLNKYGDTIALTSTIVASQKSGGDIFVQSGSVSGNNNLIGDGSGISGGTGNLLGTPAQPLNPLLAPLGDYGGPTLTMALLLGSPALGKGDPAQAGSNDQRGQSRGAVVDIGAFQQNREAMLVVGDATDEAGTASGKYSLRQAVNLAALLPVIDTIMFDPAVFGSAPHTIALSRGQFALINRATTIIGPGAALLTINGGGNSRIFDIEGGTAALSGLTMTGGQAYNGGGLYHSGGTLSLTGCTISGNAATSLGGGLGNEVGTVTLTNCAVNENTASAGAGVGNFIGAVTLTNCTVSGNTADHGGGLYGYNLNLTDCNVSGNSATNPNSGGGGGLYIKEGRAQLLGCTISGNSAAHSGGGVLSQGGTIALTNCTISGNTATAEGGGVFNYGLYGYLSSASLTNCTVSGNSAALGAGLSNAGDSNVTGHQATITLTNTIVARQQAGADIVVQAGNVTGNNNLVGDGSGISGGTGNLLGTPSQPLNPLLAALGNYGGPTQTLALLPGSPAIGGGTATGAPAADQRGFVRGSVIDMGAFQHQAFTLTPVAGSTPQATPFGTAFTAPLAVTVTASNSGQFINPVDGGVIAFAAPVAGASATLSAVSATIAQGLASVSATAGTMLGSYTVTASAAGGTTPAAFSLSNTEAPSLVVDTALDDVDGTDGKTSLREALAFASSRAEASTVTFAPSVFGPVPQTITLAHGPLKLSGGAKSNITIAGPGVSLLIVSGNNTSGVFDVEGGSATLSGLTMTGGRDVHGGGLYNNGGNVSLLNATVTNNAANQGGGVFNQTGGTIRLLNATINNNFSAVGGGLYNNTSGTMSLANCTITGNTAGDSGGGLYNNASGTMSLVNCTVSGNSAGVTGGGLYISPGATALLTDTIVAGRNAAGDIRGIVNSASANNLVGSGAGMTGIQNGSQGNQVGAVQSPIDPLLAAVGAYGGPTATMPLLPGSPAIGGGLAGPGVPTTDQRGQPRPQSGPVDIGAFESGGYVLTLVNGSTPQSAAVNAAFTNPLGVTVTAVNPVEPVDGGVVRFTVPAAGASAVLSAASAVIVSGQAGMMPTASVTAMANNTPGAYTVDASAAGAASVSFVLTNTEAASLVLTTTRDVVDQFDGLTSLREAIALANSHPGPDTITFDPGTFPVRRTIRLTGGPLVLTDPATTTIVGPGARRLTLQGDGRNRALEILGGSLALSGLTIAGGRADRGGGLRNDAGTLLLNRVVLRNNFASFFGGGLYNAGKADLIDVIVRANRARVGGGLANFGILAFRRLAIRNNAANFANGLFEASAGRLIRLKRAAASGAVMPPETTISSRAATPRGVLGHIWPVHISQHSKHD